jgi:hypothetical protein
VKIISTLAAVMAVATLSAQDAPNAQEARLLLFGEFVQPMKYQVATGISDQADGQVGGGLRFMGQVVPSSRWFYELSGRLESSSNFTNISSVGADLSKVKVTYSYWSVGGAYLLPLGKAADLGFHLEARSENVRVQGSAFYTVGGVTVQDPADGGNTFMRPWARVSLDFSIPMESKAFILGADAGIALLRTYQTDTGMLLSQMDDRTTRSLAPQAAFGVYVGLKF